MAAHLEGFSKRRLGTVLAGVVVTMFAPLAARAQCTVTNLSDSGSGSLRACVAAANAATTPVTFTINFNSLLDGQTITLTSGNGPLTLSNSTSGVTIAITGPGANLLTISGGNAIEVLDISSGTVTISGLTIANGNGS